MILFLCYRIFCEGKGDYWLGTVHKRRPHKIAKNDLSRPPLTALAKLPCPCEHTINFKKSEVFAQKSANVRIWRIPLTPRPKNVRIEQTPSPWLRKSLIDGPLVSLIFEIKMCFFKQDATYTGDNDAFYPHNPIA